MAIVQSVNAMERTATILYSDTGTLGLASVLELDPHGPTDAQTVDHTAEEFGVHLGDFVFIHREGTSNGLPKPRVPKIGEVEDWVRDVSPDSGGRIAVTGWRKDMCDIGNRIATQRAMEAVEDGKIRHPNESDSFTWFGEVTDVSHPPSPLPLTQANVTILLGSP